MKKGSRDDMKFKVGDRVVYRANVAGNGRMNGMHGTVVFVDDTRSPYTVEFDSYLPGGVTDERVKRRRYTPEHGKHWFCQEENLEREGEWA